MSTKDWFCENCEETSGRCVMCGEFHCHDCDECDPRAVASERAADEMQRGWDEVKE